MDRLELTLFGAVFRFVNVFHGVQKATVLLANPVGENVVASHAALAAQAAHVLGLRGRGALRLYDAATGLAVDDDGRQVESLNGATLQVVRVASEAAPPLSPFRASTHCWTSHGEEAARRSRRCTVRERPPEARPPGSRARGGGRGRICW